MLEQTQKACKSGNDTQPLPKARFREGYIAAGRHGVQAPSGSAGERQDAVLGFARMPLAACE